MTIPYGTGRRVSGLGATGGASQERGRDLCCWRKQAGLDSLRALLGAGRACFARVSGQKGGGLGLGPLHVKDLLLSLG